MICCDSILIFNLIFLFSLIGYNVFSGIDKLHNGIKNENL